MLGIHADFIEVETVGRGREELEDYVAVGHKHNGLLSINGIENLIDTTYTLCNALRKFDILPFVFPLGKIFLLLSYLRGSDDDSEQIGYFLLLSTQSRNSEKSLFLESIIFSNCYVYLKEIFARDNERR